MSRPSIPEHAGPDADREKMNEYMAVIMPKDFAGAVNLMAMDPLDVYRYRFETRDRTHVQTARTQPSMRRATLNVRSRRPHTSVRAGTLEGQAPR